MIIIPEEIIKEIYEKIGSFTFKSSVSTIEFNIENPTVERVNLLYDFLYNRVYAKVLIKTNFDDVFSYSDFCTKKLKEHEEYYIRVD